MNGRLTLLTGKTSANCERPTLTLKMSNYPIAYRINTEL